MSMKEHRGHMKREKSPNWKGGIGKAVLNKRVGRFYCWVYERNGQVLRYRLIMEKILGRKLLRIEFVHHKNGDKLDDRPENLELISPKNHTALHGPSRLGIPHTEETKDKMRAASKLRKRKSKYDVQPL